MGMAFFRHSPANAGVQGTGRISWRPGFLLAQENK